MQGSVGVREQKKIQQKYLIINYQIIKSHDKYDRYGRYPGVKLA